MDKLRTTRILFGAIILLLVFTAATSAQSRTGSRQKKADKPSGVQAGAGASGDEQALPDPNPYSIENGSGEPVVEQDADETEPGETEEEDEDGAAADDLLQQGSEPEDIEQTGVKVLLRSNQPGVAFHNAEVMPVQGARGLMTEWKFRRICSADCEAPVMPGRYRMALSHELREPILLDDQVQIDGPSIVEGIYQSRAAERMTGWLIMGIGGVSALGTTVMGIALAAQGGSNEELGVATLIGGGVTFVLSVVTGAILASMNDRAEIQVRPIPKK